MNPRGLHCADEHTTAVVELGSHGPAEPERRRLPPRQALYDNKQPLEPLDLSEAERAEVLAEIERWSERQTEEQARWLRRRASRIDVLRMACGAAAAFGD